MEDPSLVEKMEADKSKNIGKKPEQTADEVPGGSTGQETYEDITEAPTPEKIRIYEPEGEMEDIAYEVAADFFRGAAEHSNQLFETERRSDPETGLVNQGWMKPSGERTMEAQVFEDVFLDLEDSWTTKYTDSFAGYDQKREDVPEIFEIFSRPEPLIAFEQLDKGSVDTENARDYLDIDLLENHSMLENEEVTEKGKAFRAATEEFYSKVADITRERADEYRNLEMLDPEDVTMYGNLRLLNKNGVYPSLSREKL